MKVIRPIRKQDQEAFVTFAFESTLGIRNLPKDCEKLQDKINRSLHSFSQDIHKPGPEEYTFVLEDLATGQVGGTCGIFAQVNRANSFCYRIKTIRTRAKHDLSPKEMQILKFCTIDKTVSEVCALYLHPTFRHSRQGRLLSLSRFLFMAAYPHRFEKRVVAEMRGFINQDQTSPFWDAVGYHFCNLSFMEVMKQVDQKKINLREILPQYPIYIALLPKEAQVVIGQTHERTKPAMHLLLTEGFTFNQEVDVLEAGPVLEAPIHRIRSVKQSRLIKIETTTDLLSDEKDFILANEQLDFRACSGKLQIINKQCGIIHQEVAEALHIKSGGTIRYVSLH